MYCLTAFRCIHKHRVNNLQLLQVSVFVSIGSLFTRMCIASGRRTVISAATKEIPEINIAPFRVAESPDGHDTNCLNRIYTVPPDITTLLGENVPNELKLQATVFREFGILIRKPGIEIMSYLEQADYTKSINKYILCILLKLF